MGTRRAGGSSSRRSGRSTVTISRFVTGGDVVRTEVPARVADVIRELARQQASYPDIVQLLVEADRQRNLMSSIGIDALPQAGRIYTRPAGANAVASQTPVGGGALAPNLFGGLPDKPDENAEPEFIEEAPIEQTVDETEQTTLSTGAPGPVGFTVQ